MLGPEGEGLSDLSARYSSHSTQQLSLEVAAIILRTEGEGRLREGN